jgi:S1-C subfamily serine protease
MVATYKDDPTGATAIERAFGEPLGKIELRWRKWMRERGAVDDRVEPGDPSLGVLGDDVGDGVRITSFAPGSAARAAGLRVGDVIQSVAGSPIRNKDELVLAIARLRAGETVEVRFRRSGEETALMVLPRPLGR